MASRGDLSDIQVFWRKVYEHTEFENRDEADAEFHEVQLELAKTPQSPDGSKLTQQCSVLSCTVMAESTFKDVVKIIWRMVKSMGSSARQKLCLFLLGIHTVYLTVAKGRCGKESHLWLEHIYQWLGKQLTIGGKGVAGAGEGSVQDRIKRFFVTPYLHDFD